MIITGGQAIIKALEAEGVKIVFGYPGGAILPVYDSLRESNIHHVLVRNEQGAAHSASGYAKSSGNVGVCIATSGPGATNLITGIATAYMDSIPIIAITGQVPVDMIGRDVFQEVDITGATAPFCKHNYLIKNANDIPRIIKEAFHIASTGRPGPVLIDIPKDIAQSKIDFKYPDTIDLRGYKPNYNGHPMQIKKAAGIIKNSKNPVICTGGGCISSNATNEIVEFAKRINAPVATTLMGIGAFPESLSSSLGMLGLHGMENANKAIKEADVLIVLGARMGDRATGKRDEFAKDAIIIHIDIDPAEIGKNISTEIPIVGDVRKTLIELLKQDIDRDTPLWIQKKNDEDIYYGEDNKLGVPGIVTELSKLTYKNTIIVTDVGQHQMWAGQYYEVEKPRTFVTSGGLGTMGYGLPAAIGAKMANPDSNVILITGDGSLQMSLQELATLSQENLDIKILLMNNSCLGMVRELEYLYSDKKYFSVYMKGNPDFIKLADAYGIKGIRINKLSSIKQSIENMLSYKGAMLCEFIVDPDYNVTPSKGGDLK